MARLMLDASATEYVQRRLHVALGDLYNLAGWVHFARALVLAGWGRNNGLVANVCYRLGRVCLHHESLDEVRKGEGDRALDLSAVIGAVHTDLAQTMNHSHTRTAIPLLTEAVDHYGDGMARSRAFSLILLSINHLVDRDVDHGVAVGMRALAAAEPWPRRVSVIASARLAGKRSATALTLVHWSSPPASPATPAHPCGDIGTFRRRSCQRSTSTTPCVGSAVRQPAMEWVCEGLGFRGDHIGEE